MGLQLGGTVLRALVPPSSAPKRISQMLPDGQSPILTLLVACHQAA